VSSHTAVEFYGLAAQYAEKLDGINGPGTFVPAFIDALSSNTNDLLGGIK